MTNFYKKVLLVFTITCFCNFGFSQSNEIKIKFIGNCGLFMTDGKNNFYVDFPYKSGAYKYMEYDKSEIDAIKDNAIFIFTHRHADHYSKKLLKKLTGKKFDPWNINELEKLGETILNFDIKAFQTSHKVFGLSFKHYSYLITWHDRKIYISGDTGDLEELSKIKNIDWAFVNPWLYMNAQNEKVTIDAKNFGMYHLYPQQEINGEAPKNLIILKNQGEVITIPY